MEALERQQWIPRDSLTKYRVSFGTGTRASRFQDRKRGGTAGAT